MSTWTALDHKIMQHVNDRERAYWLEQNERRSWLGWLFDMLVGGN